jgi:hypothetical protein
MVSSEAPRSSSNRGGDRAAAELALLDDEVTVPSPVRAGGMAQMHVLRSAAHDELKLRGTCSEYGDLAGLVVAGRGSLSLAPVADPRPYDGALDEITVERRPTQGVTIKLSSDACTLEISGDEAHLTVLAENLSEFGEDCTPGDHMHIDYFPGHFYLGSTSHPLVIALTEADDASMKGQDTKLS